MKKFLKRLAVFLAFGLPACAVVLLSADLVINAVPPVEGARSKIHTAQPVLRPALSFPLGRRVLLSADFVAPIAGSLGGSTFSGSLLVTTSW